MSRIEQVVKELQQVGDNIETVAASMSSALASTDEAIHGAIDVGTHDKVAGLNQVRDTINQLQAQNQGLKSTTDELVAHVEGLAGGS